jgi:hypothetical protein
MQLPNPEQQFWNAPGGSVGPGSQLREQTPVGAPAESKHGTHTSEGSHVEVAYEVPSANSGKQVEAQRPSTPSSVRQRGSTNRPPVWM